MQKKKQSNNVKNSELNVFVQTTTIQISRKNKNLDMRRRTWDKVLPSDLELILHTHTHTYTHMCFNIIFCIVL